MGGEAVWVYTRSGGVWYPQGGPLVGTGGASQVASVALSSDGNVLVVGGPSDNASIGAAWVFTRSDGVWTQQGGKLVGGGAAGAAQQGSSVSVSGDGNTLVVGGPGDNSGIGAAWVFTQSGDVWTQQGGKLVGSGATGAVQQASSVSISGDGNTLVVGGPGDNSGTGAAWVFTRSGGIWTQQGGKLAGSGVNGTAEPAGQGNSVSVSGDGNTLVVGGPFDNLGVGAAWVFTRLGGTWSQLGSKLTGTDVTPQTPALQGIAVAISGDASTVVAGGPQDGVGFFNGDGDIGAVWPYVISGSPPLITGFSPTAATALGPQITLTVIGANFLPGAVVSWNGTALPTTFVSATQVTAPVAASLFSAVEAASITVANRDGNTSAASVYPVLLPVSITGPDSLSAGTYGVAYTATITVSGGLAPYAFSAPGLPAGLSLGATGKPAVSGTYAFTITVTDSNLATASRSYSLTIAPMIACTPSQLKFAYALAGPPPAGATCTVTGSPGVSVGVSVISSGWLSASAGSGVTPTLVTISINTTGLLPGAYSGDLAITVGSLETSLPVSLAVYPAGACLFSLAAGNTANLTSAGTDTATTYPGGVLPQNPVTVTIVPAAGADCGSPYTLASSGSWLTATVSGSSFTYIAQSNAQSTPRSATLTIGSPDGETQNFTVTEAGDPESLQDRQLRALYQSILGRDPDPAGFAFWTSEGAAGLGQMADSFLTSPEAFNVDFAVMAAYQAATGSAPGYNPFASAAGSIRAATQTVAQLFDSLILSNPNFAAPDLYLNLLGRPPAPQEACTGDLAACFLALIGYPASSNPVTAMNLDSHNMLYIAMLYYTILGRDYDPPGYDFWLAVANTGGPGILFQGAAGYPTRIQILGPGISDQGFLGSQEFQGLYQ